VNRNGFDLGEFADDLEVHARKILSRPLLPQTLLLEATNPLKGPTPYRHHPVTSTTRSAVPTANPDAPAGSSRPSRPDMPTV
jgi:hypothetical protein